MILRDRLAGGFLQAHDLVHAHQNKPWRISVDENDRTILGRGG